ncbi:hypothetical protein [Haliangium sp.]|uniref:hypothetical protein n=1 Tax=Haliangium sp. TaxID=2663208 RepID=UPI003D0F864F
MLAAHSSLPDGVFWSAPLPPDSDFTAEDPLALDYLAQQVGLWLFPGFTTRTSRAQDYAVVLYGLHLADKAIHAYGYRSDDDTRTLLYERWERFWALATLQCRDGKLPRGDEDAMRGIRGATRAWFPGTKPLPLDFPLISRQSELGGLGAYLTSLRAYGLLSPGSLRVAPAAHEIVAAFWSEPGERDWSHLYHAYALSALDLGAKTIPRSRGRLTLAGLGRRSRLSSLVRRARRAQQERLWHALFLAARDGSTLALAERVIAAHEDGVSASEHILAGLLRGRWSGLSADTRNKVEVALAFGRLSRVLLGRFNRAYGYVHDHGWVADVDAVAEAAFPRQDAKELQAACGAVLAARDGSRFSKLQYHGPGLISLLSKLHASGPDDSLRHLLGFHHQVQRSRRGGGAWVREEQGKLVMKVAGYSGHASEPGFPPLKLNVIRRLLTDLGRIT